MNKSSGVFLGAVTAAAFFGLSMSSSKAALVINEVYGGGGSSNTTATYQQDFVELYNNSSSPVLLSGYLLQYSAAGAGSSFTNPIFSFGPGSVIGANDYLLINTGAVGTGGAVNPTANGTGLASLSGSSGSVRFLDDVGSTVDLVGYGTIPASTTTPPTVKFEGTAPAPTESITSSDSRTNFVDTNSNSADFTGGTPSPTFGATSVAIPAPVPEPASLGLLAIAGAALLRRRAAC